MELQARQRLNAFGTNKIDKSSIQRELWVAIAEYADQAKKFRQVSTDKSVDIWFYDQVVFATVPDSWAPVGYVELKEMWSDYTSVEISVVAKDFLGRGIGMAMYEGVLKAVGNLASSDNLSKGSSALWQKLVTKYKGWLIVGPDESPTGKEVRVKVVDWTTINGIVYPVVETDKGRQNLLDLTKRGRNPDSRDAAMSAYYLIERK